MSRFIVIRNIDSLNCGMLVTGFRKEAEFFRLTVRYFDLNSISSVTSDDLVMYPIDSFYTQFEVCTNFNEAADVSEFNWVLVNDYTEGLFG